MHNEILTGSGAVGGHVKTSTARRARAFSEDFRESASLLQEFFEKVQLAMSFFIFALIVLLARDRYCLKVSLLFYK